jgi:outer membrane protein
MGRSRSSPVGNGHRRSGTSRSPDAFPRPVAFPASSVPRNAERTRDDNIRPPAGVYTRMQTQAFNDAPCRRVSSIHGVVAIVLAATVVLPAGAQPTRRALSTDTVAVSLPEAVSRAPSSPARATALPQLRFTGGYTQTLENARAAIVGSVFGQNYNYNGNVNLSVPIFQGGRAVGGIQAARHVQAASRFNIDETKAQVSVDVQRAYLGALAAEQLVAIQERNLQLSSERVAQAEQLERAGRAARYDVLRARVERTNLEPLAIQARNDRDIAYLQLKELLNLPLDRPVRLTTRVGIDSTDVLGMIARLGADTLRGTRGSLRAAEETAEARDAAIKVARADFLPTINVFFQSGFLALPTSPAFPTRIGRASNELCPEGSAATRICQNNGYFPDRSVGVQVSWPIFDGLRAKGNVDLAQANARIAELQLAQTRERVAVEVAQARAEAERAGALFQTQRANVAQAEEAFRLAQLRFSRGLGTQLEISDAQLALLTAQTNAVRATYDVYLAAAELDRALGRPIPIPGSTP